MEWVKGLEIHWKAPLQPKGFLKLIEMGIALLALSLVAGFTASSSGSCSEWHYLNQTFSATFQTSAKYPFNSLLVDVTLVPSDHSQIIPADEDRFLDLGNGYEQASSFFVAWGCLTLFYGVISLLVYMFTTASSKMEWFVNYLVLTDLIFHVVWVLCWLIASIEWAVAQNEMQGHIHDVVLTNVIYVNCTTGLTTNVPNSYAQAAIADVFGFTSTIIWGVNIFWVVIDTSFYLQWKARRRGGRGDNTYDEI